jgi:hypothetical protein
MLIAFSCVRAQHNAGGAHASYCAGTQTRSTPGRMR